MFKIGDTVEFDMEKIEKYFKYVYNQFVRHGYFKDIIVDIYDISNNQGLYYPNINKNDIGRMLVFNNHTTSHYGIPEFFIKQTHQTATDKCSCDIIKLMQVGCKCGGS